MQKVKKVLKVLVLQLRVRWDKTGGGTFIRTGSHPLSAILWLKQQEAKAHGIDIKGKKCHS